MPTKGTCLFYFCLQSLERITVSFVATPTPPPPHSGQQWRQLSEKMISCFFFSRLENEDSHGIPMEQHNGEIESTTKHYTNTHAHAHMRTHKHTCACWHPSTVTHKDLHNSAHLILEMKYTDKWHALLIENVSHRMCECLHGQ